MEGEEKYIERIHYEKRRTHLKKIDQLKARLRNFKTNLKRIILLLYF